jgi:2-dehydropantoate 2-reductase
MASIAVFGSGAMGQFYGGMLVRAGHQVRFHARRDAERLATQGLRLRCTPTDQVAATSTRELAIPASAFTVVATETSVLPAPDWLLITLKTTAFPDIIPVVQRQCGQHTRVAVLCNGLGIEEQIARQVDPRRIVGQLCFVCLNRDDQGVVHHLAHGQVSVGDVISGEAGSTALADLWQGAGVRCQRLPSLREARWRKLVWNIPFNGLGVRDDATTDVLLADPQRHAEVQRLMMEVIAIANADLGRPALDQSWADNRIAATHEMGAYAPSTLLDARAGQPLELDALLREPQRCARRLQVPCPALDALVAALPAA